MNPNRVRIAVTGVGLITPAGLDRESTWQTIRSGTQTTDWIEPASVDNDSRLYAARVPVEVPSGLRLNEFAIRAATEAVKHAKLTPKNLQQAAVVIGTSKCDLQAIDDAWDANEDLISRLWLSTPARVVSEKFDMHAAAICPVAACATGLVSLIRGANLIREETCDVVLAGSADASIHPGLLASYKRLGVLANPHNHPATACRPFDKNRQGFVVGEGAAVLTLERWEHALARGVAPIAEWVDGAIAADLTGMTSVDSTGDTLAHLINKVLATNSVQAKEVQGVSVHGTATPMNDLTEANALRQVFQHELKKMRCFGIKGAIGHLMGAAGAVESALSVLALRDQLIPPTANHRMTDSECLIPLAKSSTPFDLQHVLKLSLGFGGHLAVGLLKRANH